MGGRKGSAPWKKAVKPLSPMKHLGVAGFSQRSPSRPNACHVLKLSLNGGLEPTGTEHSLLLDVPANFLHVVLADRLKKQGALGATALMGRRAQSSVLVTGIDQLVWHPPALAR